MQHPLQSIKQVSCTVKGQSSVNQKLQCYSVDLFSYDSININILDLHTNIYIYTAHFESVRVFF